MHCPKCGGEFEHILNDEVGGQRCKLCSGLWFKNAPNQNDFSAEDATKIDKGDPTIGKIYDLISDVKCPSCDIVMASVSDPDQAHIKYEICGSCYGVYFDAGEFSDYVIKSENLSRIRDLMWKS